MTTTATRSPQRVLVATIRPDGGGVLAKLEFVVDQLKTEGYEPVIAHYEPYSLSPHLSVPSYKLLTSRRGQEVRWGLGGCEIHAIGAWLPELEFTHHLPTDYWKRLMDSCAYHVVVSGNVLPGLAFAETGRPFMVWAGTGWEADRVDRVATFAWPRRMLDRLVNTPIARAKERKVLRSGHICTVSDYTSRVFDEVAGGPCTAGIIPVPVEDHFRPDESAVVPWRVGFSGRLDDPRKNLPLLLDAATRLARAGRRLSVDLIGADVSPKVKSLLATVPEGCEVNVLAKLSREKLAERLRCLDVYVIPSFQEGLCIAGLEAMASGCPVISTMCGGPEDFVKPGATGLLVPFDGQAMADAIERIASDRAYRKQLGHAARALIETRYTRKHATSQLWEHFATAFGNRDGITL